MSPAQYGSSGSIFGDIKKLIMVIEGMLTYILEMDCTTENLGCFKMFLVKCF